MAAATTEADGAPVRAHGPADAALRHADPPPFSSVDTFTEYVGRHHELGIEEFIFLWPADPATRAERERVLERVSQDVLPALRA